MPRKSNIDLNIWNKYSFIGVRDQMSFDARKRVVLTNRLALVHAVFAVIIYGLYIFLSPFPSWVANYLLVPIIFVASVPILNGIGRINMAALILCLTIPTAVTIIGIIEKVYMDGAVPEAEYFGTSILVISAIAFPFLLIDSENKRWIWTVIVIDFFIILFLNELYGIWGVSYEQMGYENSGMLMFLAIAFIAGLIVAVALYFMNDIAQFYNRKLIETQVELEASNAIVSEQNSKLLVSKRALELQVKEKTANLNNLVSELSVQNQELERFAQIVSHNLRGPVANLVGLANVIKMTDSQREKDQMVGLLGDAGNDLDRITRDLNHILSTRMIPDSGQEKVNLHAVANNIRKEFQTTLEKIGGNIVLEIHNETYIQMSSSALTNVLYNLVSNAVKFRSNSRPLQVHISENTEKGNQMICVQDNGIGIDLEKHGDDLFQIYKRFHEFGTGRGLGLFLVKSQVESFGGNVAVRSENDKGTSFDIVIPTLASA